MKLRIDQQTLRFRLSETDLATLSRTGHLTETLRLTPHDNWSYALVASTADENPRIEMEAQNLKIRLPSEQLKSWIRSHEIEWHFAANHLAVWVEKDLKG